MLYQSGPDIGYASCENYIGMKEFLEASGGSEMGPHSLDARFRELEMKGKIKTQEQNEPGLESIR